VTVASLSMTPQYEASTKILIGKQAPEDPALEIEVHQLQQLTLTMAEVTRSRPIAEDTIERLGLSTRHDVFLERLQAEPIENTQFIELSYTGPDPEKAQRVANTVRDVLSQRVSEASTGDTGMTAAIWERPPVPEEPVSPNPLRNGLMVLASVLLLFVGFAVALPRVAALGIGRSAWRRPGRWARPRAARVGRPPELFARTAPRRGSCWRSQSSTAGCSTPCEKAPRRSKGFGSSRL
jgi:capsular polysaccharide biosynthesis protein